MTQDSFDSLKERDKVTSLSQHRTSWEKGADIIFLCDKSNHIKPAHTWIKMSQTFFKVHNLRFFDSLKERDKIASLSQHRTSWEKRCCYYFPMW